MGFFRRFFSADYRRALSAEAAGDYQTAARSYALCGERRKVAQMHMALAETENSVDGKIHALKLALAFTAAEQPMRQTVVRALAMALSEKADDQGLTTSDGRRTLRLAAKRLEEAGAHERAGEWWIKLNNPERAAAAYAKAGRIDKVEAILSAHENDYRRRQREQGAFKDYEALMNVGQRRAARDALRLCVKAAKRKGEYRSLLEGLESRMLEDGRVTLAVGSSVVTIVGYLPLLIGRDAECHLQVRGFSVSRTHARIQASPGGGFTLEDSGSQNGTLLQGLPIGAAVSLPQNGTLSLGGAKPAVQFTLIGSPPTALTLEVVNGIDRGRLLVAGRAPYPLNTIVPHAPEITVWFEAGRPVAQAQRGTLELNGVSITGAAELIDGDQLDLEGQHVRVAR